LVNINITDDKAYIITVCFFVLHVLLKWKYFLKARIQNTWISYVALSGNPTLHPVKHSTSPSTTKI